MLGRVLVGLLTVCWLAVAWARACWVTVTYCLFVVGGLGFEFCVFVAGWRHALRSEWPFIIIIIITVCWLAGEFVEHS